MVGGFGVNRIPLNTVDVVDVASGAVSPVGKLPQPMFSVGACVFKDKVRYTYINHNIHNVIV